MFNMRLGSLEILNIDSGSHNFSRVVLDPCYPKFQFDGYVAGGGAYLRNFGRLSIFFLIGGDRSSSLPACGSIQSKSEVGRPSPEFW
jgi:hypothetical protein